MSDANLKYTKDHECVFVEGDEVLRVGITGYAQDALGDLVYLELPEIGKKVAKGDDVAVIESVKTAAEVYSPVDGEVVGANSAMADDLEMIKNPISDDGWIVKIKLADSGALDELMDEKAYDEYLKTLD